MGIRAMKKHYNIPIFITHAGCKNECVFCNQKIITGQPKGCGEKEIRDTIEKFICRGEHCSPAKMYPIPTGEQCSPLQFYPTTEIAFFGGSFTGLEKTRMINFLKIANEYISACGRCGELQDSTGVYANSRDAEDSVPYNKITGIRLSTRPDYISKEVIDILLKYNVTAVELGVQSMFDDVLAVCKRGCTAEDIEKACVLIKSAGLNLTGQIMPGLPCSDYDKDIQTAEKLVNLGIDAARIYPAVILPGTELYNMHKRGEYTPLSLDEAVLRTKEIKKIFDVNGIKILRMGLCSSDNMNTNDCIGPYHPAFGELVESEIMYDRLVEEICRGAPQNHPAAAAAPLRGGELEIRVNPEYMSKVIGHKRKNIERLRERFPGKNIKIIKTTES